MFQESGGWKAFWWVVLAILFCVPVVKAESKIEAGPGEVWKLEQKQQRLKSEGPLRFDQPDEAQRFYVRKRSEDGNSPLSIERYLQAMEQMRSLPVYSTADGRRMESGEAPQALGTWTPLGPGNVGGRTRGLVIDPATPDTMYAGGVAGGVWKTTNGGTWWAPLSDLIANIAISSLAIDPSNSSVVYAGTGEGFFNVDAVRGAGLFKSTNGGASWTHLTNTNNSNFHYVNKVIVSPNSSSRVYAATGAGIYRSTDSGVNWSPVHNPGVQGGCTDMVIRTDQANDYIFASCGAGVQATIYRNTNAGAGGAWTSVFTESCMGRTSLALAPSSQGTLYALAASVCSGNYSGGLHAVFRSTSNGDSGTWSARVRNTDSTKLNTVLLSNPIIAFLAECGQGTSQFFNQGWYDNVIAVDPADSSIVWTGGIDLFRSNDGGATWGLASHWWAGTANAHYAHADQHAIVFHPQYNGAANKTMFVGNDGGVFKTTDARAATTNNVCSTANGVNWTELNNNYQVTQFYFGVPYPGGTTYLGGCQDNGTNRGSDGAGIDGWSQILGGDGGYVAVDPSNTSVLYAETTNLSIRKSTDGGSTFNPATNGISGDNGFQFINPFLMDPSNSQRLWTGGWVLWRTTNGAASWTQASDTTAGNGAVSALAVAPSDGNYVLAGMSDGFIHRTTTGLTTTSSTNWPVVQPRTGYVSWLAFHPTDKTIAYATYSTFGGTHVWKSSNSGATWTGLDGTGTTIPDVPVHSIAVDPSNTSRLYAGTDLGVFVTTDGGANWAVENTGFANVVTEALVVQGSTLFAFTHGRGAWRVSTAGGSCSYFLTPTSNSFDAAGGSDSVSVTTQAGCNWTAVSSDAWIQVTSGSNGTGNGTVNYTVNANAGGARTGTMTIGGQTFTVNQSAAAGGPANDNCASASSVSTTPYTNSVDTTNATTEAGDPTPSCGGGARGRSAWYRFTAPSDSEITADTFTSGYDTVLSVYTGSCGAFVPVACNDDSGGTQSRVTFSATSGTTYYFMVSAFTGAGGNLIFHLDANSSSNLYEDLFADGSASDWSVVKGLWSVVGGELQGQTSKKADIISPFTGCSACTMEAVMRIDSTGGHASMLGWYVDKKNMVEVRLMSDKGKLLLKHSTTLFTAAKKSIPLAIAPGVDYRVKVAYSAGAFSVYVDGVFLATVPTSVVPSGGVGFRMKSTTGFNATASFEEVLVY